MSIESHQCPYCELRFAAKWELEAHLADSHPERAAEREDEREEEREDDD
ncbi:MAG: hypothetical protein ACRDZ1_17765 [Acidimicrobiia bacterium]